ncbi:MAG: thioester reductase domain-containing protein, partial [Chloroflexi bacterium]|nr:thioester reductase domain-containing protein [Chloroflexota bacterium]
MSYIASSELDKEIVLDPAIQPLPGELNLNPQPQAVLVTGVTGFIAAFLIAELLETTPAQIYGFVRANDVDHGMARIRENMERYALWRPEYQQRIIPVPGDLKKPLLGLEPQYFQYLAETVEAIYHSGSKLSYIAPYGFLKAANVGGTEEALRLATTGRAKPFHFISSLGILLNYKALVGGQEDAPLDCNKCPEVGYFQTKYVAEGLTRLARDRGIPVTIHRIGLIVGDSRSGLSNFDDFVSRIILGCIEAGDAPDIHTAMDMTPVDYIAKAIIYLSFNKA